MKISKCDLCEDVVVSNGVSFGKYDLCEFCIIAVRKAICRACKGEGKLIVTDDDQSSASCGESRIETKTVRCRSCM